MADKFNIKELSDANKEYIQSHLRYECIYWNRFDYKILHRIMYRYRPGKAHDKKSYNDVIIMADTETSKNHKNKVVDGKYEPVQNHVCAWTISIRAYHINIVTLYGVKPSDMIECFDRIHTTLRGQETFIYFHNLSYDYYFIRRFLFAKFGTPERQLNTKPHYPIYLQFENGLIIKDSLILAQRGLEKWAKDLGVLHQKAVGFWDYDKIRHQKGIAFTSDEIKYIENDTLAGVECIDATIMQLNKNISTIPYTATGIPREIVRKRGAKEHAHDWFLSVAVEYIVQIILERCYHGGYTHTNRYLVGDIIDWSITKCYDFASSYPFCLMFKYPAEQFTAGDDLTIDEILNQPDYAYIFKLIMVDVDLKDANNTQMPVLQFTKCVKILNPILDNGRVLKCDYCEIYLTSIDLQLIAEQYTYSKHICTDLYMAKMDYLPRWFTDYVYECFVAKTKLKGGDPVAYSIAKSTINSLYGMCCQKPIKPDITEDYETGEFDIQECDSEELYQKYLDNRNQVLPYYIGVFCTSYALINLHKLGKCAGTWIYSDTDSCYALNWDEDAVEKYNNDCKEFLTERGYGAVHHNGKDYWLGVAESECEKDMYTEFRAMGAKRYCGRNVADGELHITVAGVPKSGAQCLNDDINNFSVGFIFDGKTTGKKLHTYIPVDDIYIDGYGNEQGDSIDLTPCDYMLDATDKFNLDLVMTDDISIQVYEEVTQ